MMGFQRAIKRALHPCLWLLLALLACANVHAGLLTEATRVIYPGDSNGRTLLIANTNPWPVLVQPWVDQGEGDPETANAAFVVLPAIFRLEPSASQHLRILYTGQALPDDRESLFWLNLYEVPPMQSDADDAQARLTLTFNTQLKVLYRPQGLGAPDDLAGQLEFSLHQADGHWMVHIHNPTPWHASFGMLRVDGEHAPFAADAADLLLPPFSTRDYPLHAGTPAPAAMLDFSLIGDSGFSEPHRARTHRADQGH